MPKLTKRERAAAAAAASASAGVVASAFPGGGAYDHPPSSEEIASLVMEAAFDIGGLKAEDTPATATTSVAPSSTGGSKRRAAEAFGGGGGGGGGGGAPSVCSEGDNESHSSKSTTMTASGRPRKTPTRTPNGRGNAATPGSADKASKGLRHFSLKVCRKVEEKGTTNYNEVADELVAEVLAQKLDPTTGLTPAEGYDEKNIRRRVYDALNVLMAMDIISKEKKEIKWKGLPSNAQHDMEVLHRDKRRLEQSLAKKREHLQELIMQRVAFQQLMRRNEARETAAAEQQQLQQEQNLQQDEEQRKIPLPFIIINTNSQTIIQCEMTEDRSDVFFNFSAPFEIADDNEILKRMQLQRAPPADVPLFVPEALRRFIPPEVYQTQM